MLRKTGLTLSASAMAALIAAAPLTSSAVAHHSQGNSWRLAERAHACTATGARSSYRQSCYRIGAGDLRGSGDRDAWGHWGTYYGPMTHLP
jgi:hypothetical protein